VLVVYGLSGIDEVSLAGETMVGELQNGVVREYTIRPEQFDLPPYHGDALKVTAAQESKERLLSVLDNRPGPPRDIVALNAGAALYAAGVAASISDGVRKAQATIASGAARAKFEQFLAYTRSFAK
jgi:anthranilate phosphoribosyltransferase